MTNESVAQSRESLGLFLIDQAMGYAYPAALRAAAIIGVADHGSDLPPEEEFYTGMFQMSQPEIQSPVGSYEFPEGATIVDVGGGYGGAVAPHLAAESDLAGHPV